MTSNRRLRSLAHIGVLTGCLLLGLTCTVSGQSSKTVPNGLRAYLERFTGPQPVDCRPLVSATDHADEASARMTSCIAEAKQGHKPFFSYDEGGERMDSWQVTGVLTTPDGAGYSFGYDSSPCGGGGCSDRFTITHCENPTVADFGLGWKVTCAAPR